MSPHWAAPTQGKRRAPDSPDLGAYRTVRNRLEDTPAGPRRCAATWAPTCSSPNANRTPRRPRRSASPPRRSLNRGRDRRPRTPRRGATLALPARWSPRPPRSRVPRGALAPRERGVGDADRDDALDRRGQQPTGREVVERGVHGQGIGLRPEGALVLPAGWPFGHWAVLRVRCVDSETPDSGRGAERPAWVQPALAAFHAGRVLFAGSTRARG
jgi:hypothetical protein